MVRYDDLPDPPNEEIIAAIEEERTWLDDIIGMPEPEVEVQRTVFEMALIADDIRKNIEDAYKERLLDKESGTMKTYEKRLKQINDAASLISAAYVGELTREELLGFTL